MYSKVADAIVLLRLSVFIVCIRRYRTYLKRIDKSTFAAGNVDPIAFEQRIIAHILVLAFRVNDDYLCAAGVLRSDDVFYRR